MPIVASYAEYGRGMPIGCGVEMIPFATKTASVYKVEGTSAESCAFELLLQPCLSRVRLALLLT